MWIVCNFVTVDSSKCLTEKLPSFESIPSVMANSGSHGSGASAGGHVGNNGAGGGGTKAKQHETVKVCNDC